MSYVQYIGTSSPHALGVTAAGSRETVEANTGVVLALDAALASAVLAAEPSLWLPVSGFPAPLMSVTGAYMVQTAANETVLASGTFPIYLPDGTSATQSPTTIKNVGSGVVTLIPAFSGQTVDGAASFALNAGEAVTVLPDGTSRWRVLSSPAMSDLPASLVNASTANTFTAEQTVPDLVVTGLTGAVAASRYVGATASGAPAAGPFAKGDFVIDQTGTLWICTVAGTPGTWVSPTPGTELGYAQITSAFTTTSTSFVDVTGLTVTVTVGSRPINVDVGGNLQNTLAGGYTGLQIVQGVSTVVQGPLQGVGTANELGTFFIRARLSLAAGSYTFKLQAASSSASNTSKLSQTATSPAWIQVTQV